jgi:hypothetical protein
MRLGIFLFMYETEKWKKSLTEFTNLKFAVGCDTLLADISTAR